jgi:hypothetical protein
VMLGGLAGATPLLVCDGGAANWNWSSIRQCLLSSPTLK